MDTNSILLAFCRGIYYSGVGNFWYEDGVIEKDNTILYRLFQVIVLGMYVTMTSLEILGAMFGDFPQDEKGDCVTFSVSHAIVIGKIYSVLLNKNTIKVLNKQIVKICKEYEGQDMMVKKYRIIKKTLIAYFFVVYGTIFCFIVQGFLKLYQGLHFVTIVSYYPHFEDDSPLATAVRVLFTINVLLMMGTMILSTDLFVVMYLITFKYKFITLRKFIEDIRTTFDRESVTDLKMASDNMKDSLLKGIRIHVELLRMSKQIDQAFNMVMALQLLLSSGSCVSLLIQLVVTEDLKLVMILKTIFFVFAMYFLLALFVCNAGEITYQAHLLSDALFYCGWHLCPNNKPVGHLVGLAMMQAQRPLHMKAFNMIEMTYATFLLVMRTTYSVFAVFYAQHK